MLILSTLLACKTLQYISLSIIKALSHQVHWSSMWVYRQSDVICFYLHLPTSVSIQLQKKKMEKDCVLFCFSRPKQIGSKVAWCKQTQHSANHRAFTGPSPSAVHKTDIGPVQLWFSKGSAHLAALCKMTLGAQGQLPEIHQQCISLLSPFMWAFQSDPPVHFSGIFQADLSEAPCRSIFQLVSNLCPFTPR